MEAWYHKEAAQAVEQLNSNLAGRSETPTGSRRLQSAGGRKEKGRHPGFSGAVQRPSGHYTDYCSRYFPADPQCGKYNRHHQRIDPQRNIRNCSAF